MIKLEHPLATDKYTSVFHEEDFENNAPHHFTVTEKARPGDRINILTKVDFQKGPIQEAGVNGVHNEDLILMVIKRLECFQKSQYSCRENALALTNLEQALQWLRQRTLAREKRGVEGTNIV